MKLTSLDQMKGKTVKEVEAENNNFHTGTRLIMRFEDGDDIVVKAAFRRGLGNSIEINIKVE